MICRLIIISSKKMEPQKEKGQKEVRHKHFHKKHHHKGPKGTHMKKVQEEIAKQRLMAQEEDTDRKRHIQAYFIGPRGENAQFFTNLITKSINSHITARTQFEASDPRHISRQIKVEPSFLDAQDKLEKELNYVNTKLRDLCAPFYSSRYYGHMNWQVTIPGLVGNFTAMLYNQNNCAFEGAPYTTLLEIEALKHFANVFSYPTMLDEDTTVPHSWGHLTCGGTVANIESEWAARNCRFLTLSLRKYTESKNQGKDIEVNLPNGNKKALSALTAWELFNIDNDETMNLYDRLFEKIGGDYGVYQDGVSQFTVGKAGLIKIYDWLRQIYTKEGGTYWPNSIIPTPLYFCSATKHYSIPKGVSLLGFGESQVHKVVVDLDSRMNITELEKKLNECLTNKVPVLCVTGIVGTTEESVVDNLVQIHRLKTDFAKKGLYFHFHIDAAYGGYFCAMRKKRTAENWDSVSQYVEQQLDTFKYSDSITFDPHKTGYVPYCCGGIIYRNHRLRDNLSFSAPYIYTGAEPNMAIYGIQGSKPGSAVTSVYLSLAVLPLNRNGHGELLDRTMMNTKIFCACLYQIPKAKIIYEYVDDSGNEKELEEYFHCYQLSRKYKEKMNTQVTDEFQSKAYLAIAQSSPLEMESVVKTGDGQNSYEDIYKQLGPDLNIVCFGLNYNTVPKVYSPNKSLAKYNQFNKQIIQTSKPVGTDKSVRLKDLYISETTIAKDAYGEKLFNDYLARHNLQDDTDDHKIVFIRSTIMNAFFTELKGHDTTSTSNDIFLEEITEAASQALVALKLR